MCHLLARIKILTYSRRIVDVDFCAGVDVEFPVSSKKEDHFSKSTAVAMEENTSKLPRYGYGGDPSGSSYPQQHMGYPVQPQAQPQWQLYSVEEGGYVPLPLAPRRSPPGSFYIPKRRCCPCQTCYVISLELLVAVLLVSVATVIVWPMNPGVDVVEMKLTGISLDTKGSSKLHPEIFLDLGLKLKLRISNPNFFGFSYDTMTIYISYRGDELGKLVLKGGRIPARDTVVENAHLDLHGIQVLSNVANLLIDISRKKIPLETKTVFSGAVELWVFRPHIQAIVECDMVVNPDNEEIVSQTCRLP